MKRSHEPLFWALFGAGGMVSALIAPALVALTGIAVPLGLLLPDGAMRYANMLALLKTPWARLALVVVLGLFLFHACHRLLHSLHDLGWPTGRGARWGFYGFAAAASLLTGVLALRLG